MCTIGFRHARSISSTGLPVSAIEDNIAAIMKRYNRITRHCKNTKREMDFGMDSKLSKVSIMSKGSAFLNTLKIVC